MKCVVTVSRTASPGAHNLLRVIVLPRERVAALLPFSSRIAIAANASRWLAFVCGMR
jgi:hypothetical protein